MKTEKTLRHWLHIILSLLTGGLWLAVYGILIAVNEMNNRVVRGYNQGRRDALEEWEPTQDCKEAYQQGHADALARYVEKAIQGINADPRMQHERPH